MKFLILIFVFFFIFSFSAVESRRFSASRSIRVKINFEQSNEESIKMNHENNNLRSNSDPTILSAISDFDASAEPPPFSAVAIQPSNPEPVADSEADSKAAETREFQILDHPIERIPQIPPEVASIPLSGSSFNELTGTNFRPKNYATYLDHHNRIHISTAPQLSEICQQTFSSSQFGILKGKLLKLFSSEEFFSSSPICEAKIKQICLFWAIRLKNSKKFIQSCNQGEIQYS